MNEQIKQAFVKFARDVAVAFIGLVLALAAIAQLMPAQITAQGVGVQPAQIFRSIRTTQNIQNDGTLAQTGASTFTGDATFGNASATNLTATTITTTNLISQVVNFNASGIVTATAVVINSTPVFWATPIPTATPITGKVIAPTAVTINGTPVFWATPQSTATPALKSTTTAQGCVLWSGTVTDTITVADHGFTTVNMVMPSLAQAATGDATGVYFSISGITVTLGVHNSALTPAPNSTGAAVRAWICGQ